MSEHPMRILVTGAAGYLASWVVRELLEAGHVVHATVRDLDDHAKLAHLTDMAERFAGRLKMFEADLLAEGSFDRAMAGCELVIHTASPYFLAQPRDPEAELVRPALHGTLNVLASVNRTESVRRVVLTSSIAALYADACDVGAATHHTVEETDTNPDTVIKHNPYAYSKTVAERAAWEAHGIQNRWDLVTIHPGAIFGPSLSRRTDATSVGMLLQFLDGSFRAGVPRLWLGVVDVRDAAAAHVGAALLPAAHGRYIAVADSLTLLQIANLMRVGDFGLQNKLPRRETSKALVWLIAPLVGLRRRYVARNVNYPLYFNGSRCVRELGLHYRPPAETFNDHIRQIVENRLLPVSGAR